MTTIKALCVWVALVCIRWVGFASLANSLVACKADDRALTVFAAASLRDVFTELGKEFERTHDTKVTFNFAGSQELRTQIEHGAPADVFAAADEVHMGALVDKKRVVSPRVFATNGLVVVVADEARDRIRALPDLPLAERIVIGGDTVPVGRYTLQMLDKANQVLGADFRARVEAKVVSRELNVRQVLAKVKLGEADAGVVYRTDAATAKGLATVAIPPELDVVARYPIAVVVDAPHGEWAARWIDHVTGDAGKRALTHAGFVVAPTAP